MMVKPSKAEEGAAAAAAAARKLLPARSSRGTRIRQLVGEEADADASFWSQDAWREDEEDADYSTEEEEEDVVDSDFDERENPDEDIHDADADRDAADGSGRKRTGGGVYREPMKPKQAARGGLLVSKKPRVAPPPANGGLADTAAPAATTPLLPPPVPAVFQYEAPTVRRSTVRKSSASSELRKRVTEEAARGAERRLSTAAGGGGGGGGGQGPTGTTRLTQAQLLAEAVRTEVENLQSLSRLEQLEEEKKAESVPPKAPFTGRMVRFHSRIGTPNTITFLNTAELPALFRQPKPKKRERSPASLPQQRLQPPEQERGERSGVESREQGVDGAVALVAADAARQTQ
ncbi:hypothetical protein PybrP1_007291 [[Pythium] brassicae (nom. inval.)]|nr:hypothetical protein PybrP1_007291 [[Pythium] brassicae (nom. inval.)]